MAVTQSRTPELNKIFLFIIFFLKIYSCINLSETDSTYWSELENKYGIGGNIILTEQESIANKMIMDAKKMELDARISDYKNSKVFQYLKRMPKGAALHVSDMAMCSNDFLIFITYKRENMLWACVRTERFKIVALRISASKPKEISQRDLCEWMPIRDVRLIYGTFVVETHLRDRLKIHDSSSWQSFTEIFKFLEGFLFHVDVYKECFMKALTEFYDDGIQYIEFRSYLPNLYFKDGYELSNFHTAESYRFALKMFKRIQSDFIGVKFIYCPSFALDPIDMPTMINTTVALQEHFADIFAGFEITDAINVTSLNVQKKLKKINGNIKYNFHINDRKRMSELSSGQNIYDATLMGVRRIWDGSALITRPLLTGLVKKRNTAIEISPFSKLQLIKEFSFHPWMHFFANNFSIVISSDYSTLWEITPSTHDFYVAFMQIASPVADLRFLKQLAMNSIKYSSMNEFEKMEAERKWHAKWNDYISKF